MGHRPRQGIAIFSVRIEFRRSTALADTSQKGSEVAGGFFVRTVNHVLCHGTQYIPLCTGVWPALANPHGPLIQCYLASDLREGVLSQIFPGTPCEFAQPRADLGVLLGA